MVSLSQLSIFLLRIFRHVLIKSWRKYNSVVQMYFPCEFGPRGTYLNDFRKFQVIDVPSVYFFILDRNHVIPNFWISMELPEKNVSESTFICICLKQVIKGKQIFLSIVGCLDTSSLPLCDRCQSISTRI